MTYKIGSKFNIINEDIELKTCCQQRLNANGRMVVRRKIVHLLKIVLAGKRCFQNCPPAFSLDRCVGIMTRPRIVCIILKFEMIKHQKIDSAKQYWELLILTISGKTIDEHKCINPDGTVYFHELAEGVNVVIFNIEPKSDLKKELVFDYSEAENIDYIISFSQRNVEIMNQENTKYDITESVGFIMMDKRHRLILNPSLLGYDSSVTIYLSKEGIHQLGLQDYLSILETIDIRFFDTFDDVGLVLMNIMKTFLSDSPIVYPLQQKLTEALIYIAFEHLYQQEKSVFNVQNYSKDNSRLSQLYQVQSHIYKNITTKPDINFLSMKFKIPKPELENDFLSLSGKTIYAYYQNARVLKARELLVSKEKTVKEISFYLGFSDVPHFSRSFKNKFKYSPMEYIKRYKL